MNFRIFRTFSGKWSAELTSGGFVFRATDDSKEKALATMLKSAPPEARKLIENFVDRGVGQVGLIGFNSSTVTKTGVKTDGDTVLPFEEI